MIKTRSRAYRQHRQQKFVRVNLALGVGFQHKSFSCFVYSYLILIREIFVYDTCLYFCISISFDGDTKLPVLNIERS